MRNPLDVARNPQPYQIPLYYPPFPSVINQQPKQSGVQQAVASALRNYQNVNAAELRRLRGDLTAYRQEAQTVFHQNVAFPRATVDVGSFDGASITGSDIAGSDIASTSSATTAAEPDSDYVPSSASSASTRSFGRAESLVADIKGLVADLYSSESESEGALMRRAGAGAGRLTEPEMTTDTQFSPTDVSDFEGLTSGASVGRGGQHGVAAAGGGTFKRVSFPDIDLTEPESDFAPRASQSERKARRTRKYVDNPSNRRLGRVGKSY